MSKLTLLAAATALSVLSATAQNITIPAPALGPFAGSSGNYFTPGGVNRFQMVFDASNFTSQNLFAPISITRVQFLYGGGATPTNIVTFPSVTVYLQPSAVDFAVQSTTFALNRTIDPLPAPNFAGPVTTIVGSYYVDIPLTTPFSFDPSAGVDLLLEIEVNGAPTPALGNSQATTFTATPPGNACNVMRSVGSITNPVGANSAWVPIVQFDYVPQNPQEYCVAGTSTNGCTPSIQANLHPNTASIAGCVITTSGVEGQKQGLVFYGVDNTGFTPTPWGAGSTSFLCVKPPTTRLGAPMNSGGTIGQCDGSYVINWDAFQLANPSALGNPWIAGDKVFVQSWYRDPLAVKTSNLSNALELVMRSTGGGGSPIPGMRLIPPGTFLMGSDAPSTPPYYNNFLSQPVHQVTISYPFWMGQYEVTEAEWMAVMGVWSWPWPPNPTASYPVQHINRGSAQSYCLRLNLFQAGNLPEGYEYRLPTEAEWEYACRAGTATEFHYGPELLCSQARFNFSLHTNPISVCGNPLTSPSWLGPAPVGSYAPNAFGLYDMHGNLREWCLDSPDSEAPYDAAAVTNPFVTGGSWQVQRGGSYGDNSDGCRSAHRHLNIGFAPYQGFRVVLAPILVP